MRKHGGTPSRRDKHVTLAAISPPGVALGRFVGGQQSGLAGSKPPPLFTRDASSCSSQGRRQGEPWGASPRPSAPTYLPTSKGIGSVASSLPLAGPDEGSILEVFELVSVWAETAPFQLPTPRGQWRGHISSSEESWDLPLREHGESLSVGLGAPWFPGTRLWLGGTPPLLAGFQGPD